MHIGVRVCEFIENAAARFVEHIREYTYTRAYQPAYVVDSHPTH